MFLDCSNWKEFKIREVFTISKCKCNCANDLIDGNSICYIGAKKSENGVMRLVDYEANKQLVSPGNSIVFICDGQGSVGYSIYMDKDFIGSTTLCIGRNDFLNKYNAMFLVTIIDLQRERFCYGRKWSRTLEDTVIKLPQDNEGNPDWDYMTEFIRRKWVNNLSTKNKNSNEKINFEKCKYFKLSYLFDCVLSKGDLKADDCIDGDIPLISSGDVNNGVVKFIDKEGDGKAKIFKGNCLTLDMFCKAYYQNKDFYSVSHGRINILIPKFKFNKYIGLFIASVINIERFRFSYGRAVYNSTAENLEIKLPVNKENEPDWDYMERYIKTLPYSDLI